MLKHEDNERLVRVGPGTPAGEMMRRYWQPILLAWELAERDGAPLRVRLLGEDLLAFRDTEGRVGLVDAYCPHRRAPLFYGRNEECGLRCVYHGWKFDVDGTCVDLPSEPADSPMKSKVRLTSYPTYEKGGVIWAYLGPPALRPEPPDYEWMRAPETHRHVTKTYESCNWLQAVEGGLDTSHSSFLHNNDLHNKKLLRNQDGAPNIDVHETDYGYHYVSTRHMKDGQSKYVRVYHYVMPWQQMRGAVTHAAGGRNEVPKLDGHIWVPIDDEQTLTWNWSCGYDRDAPITPEYAEAMDRSSGRGKDDYVPGTFRLKRSVANDHLIDRQMQKTVNFTGIVGVNTQDMALQEGMGPIVDRSKEYLGTSDRAIIALRRMLLDATHAVARGERPPAADPATHRGIRPHDTVIPVEADWREVIGPELVAKW